jgi:hypothetical protein
VGIVCQGLLQYLAVAFPQVVRNCFGSWLHTFRPGIPPSELVVANALRQSLPEFLLNTAPSNILAKLYQHNGHLPSGLLNRISAETLDSRVQPVDQINDGVERHPVSSTSCARQRLRSR